MGFLKEFKEGIILALKETQANINPSTYAAKVDYIVFDFETTGLSVRSCEILQIAAVKVYNGNIIDTYCRFIRPKGSIDPKASAVNHITFDTVKDAPYIQDVLPSFYDFSQNRLHLPLDVNKRRHFMEIGKYICAEMEICRLLKSF